MTYEEIIKLGFERIEQKDTALFNETGYYGYILQKEYPKLNIVISILCPANEPEWKMFFYENDTGDALKTHPFDKKDIKAVVEALDYISKKANRIQP